MKMEHKQKHNLKKNVKLEIKVLRNEIQVAGKHEINWSFIISNFNKTFAMLFASCLDFHKKKGNY